MIAIISELINEAAKTKFKGIEINKLLEAVELKLGGDRFELAGGYRGKASIRRGSKKGTGKRA